MSATWPLPGILNEADYLAEGSFAAIAGVTAEGKHTPSIAASVFLAIIGIFAFFAVLLRFV
jgi:putative membrane protein